MKPGVCFGIKKNKKTLSPMEALASKCFDDTSDMAGLTSVTFEEGDVF